MVLYFIEARSGCSCCAEEENHYRGPFQSKEDAQRRIDYYLSKDSKFWPTASQFANRGRYSITEEKGELITEDRIIIGDKVFDYTNFIQVNPDGTVDSNEDERFTKNFY